MITLTDTSLYNNVVLTMTMPLYGIVIANTTWQSLLTQHYYYQYADCYMQTKYTKCIENYYNKGGPDIGD